MLPDLSWRDLTAIIALAMAVGGIAIAWIRMRLSGDFATLADIGVLNDRLQEVEERIANLPHHDDVRVLSDRVAETEKGVAVVGEQVRTVAAGVTRLERMTELLVQHQIGKTTP